MSKPPATDYIDKDGFRANVGIVLTRGIAGGVSGRPGRRPRLAVPAGRRQPRRTGRRGAVSRTQGGNRPGAPGRGGAGLDPRLAALSPAAAIRARPLHRTEAALVSAAGSSADESKLRFDCTATPEFDRWRWADYWTPVREVVYFKRRVYVRALHDLGAADVSRRACRRIPSGGRKSRPRTPESRPAQSARPGLDHGQDARCRSAAARAPR